MPTIMPGAEPMSHAGGPMGALCIHGFTGNPTSMRPVADAFVAAGFTVELPRLPGHGTTVEDMIPTRWSDWSQAALDAYDSLAARCEAVVVAGLSMGGGLTVFTATKRPVAGIVAINALVKPLDDVTLEFIRGMLAEGPTVAAIGSDVADPDAIESAYDATPIEPLLSMMEGVTAMQADLASITCPTLIMTSPQDHVVDPSNSDHLAASVSGPVERITLERSYHVATLDFDGPLIRERAVEFGKKVCAR